MAKTKGYTLMLSISFWSSAYHGVSRSCARGPCSDSSGLPSLARNTSSWPWDLCSTSPASYTTAAVQQPIQQGILSVNILDEKDTTRSDVVLMMWSWEPIIQQNVKALRLFLFDTPSNTQGLPDSQPPPGCLAQTPPMPWYLDWYPSQPARPALRAEGMPPHQQAAIGLDADLGHGEVIGPSARPKCCS